MEAPTEAFSRKPGIPLYEQVRAWLLTQVTSGQWPAHYLLPPEVKLAQELGVSRVTLRRAIMELVELSLFTRISGQGTFVSSRPETERSRSANVQPRLHEQQLVAVVVPQPTATFVSMLISQLEQALYARGYRMLLINTQNSLALQSQHLLQLADFGVAGILLYSGSFFHDETVRTLLQRRVPLVLLDRYYPTIQTHLVTSDHAQGAYMLTDYLIQRGHQRIGFILTKTEVMTATLARLEGYKAALKDNALPVEEDLILNAFLRETTLQTYLQRVRPTAIFTCNDDLAIECMHLLRLLGVQVPEAMALAGFDDIPLASRLSPPLTTVAQNVRQLGEAAVQLLMESMHNSKLPPQTITIPTELVPRQSCGEGLNAEVSNLSSAEHR